MFICGFVSTCKAVGAGMVTSNGFEAAGKTPEGPAGVVAVKFVVKVLR